LAGKEKEETRVILEEGRKSKRGSLDHEIEREKGTKALGRS